MGLSVSSERTRGEAYTYDLSVERYNVEEEREGRYIVSIYTSTHGTCDDQSIQAYDVIAVPIFVLSECGN